MTISVGQKLPDATLKIVTADGAKDISTAEFFGGQKVVLFGVPGAFTPTCSNTHLPGYLENRDAILAKGVDDIVVVAVNDHHVMGAWAKATGAAGKLRFILPPANSGSAGTFDFLRATDTDGGEGPGPPRPPRIRPPSGAAAAMPVRTSVFMLTATSTIRPWMIM